MRNKKNLQYEELFIENVYSHSEDTGFFAGELDDGRLVIGNAPVPPLGEVAAFGLWVEYFSKFHGEKIPQFKAERIFYKTTEQSYIAMIRAGYIPGIGEKKAKHVWNELGIDVFKVLDACAMGDDSVIVAGISRDPFTAITSVKGIGKISGKKIIEAWLLKDTSELEYDAEAMLIGLTKAQVKEAKQKWGGTGMVNVIRNFPYRLTSLKRWGWEDSDLLAQIATEHREPIGWDSVQRLAAAMREVVRRNLINGHTTLPIQDVLNEAHALARPTSRELWMSVKPHLWEEELVLDNGYITTQRLFDMERESASILVELMTDFPPMPIRIQGDVNDYADMPLSDDQVEAVMLALKEPVCVITGGPGTGKTNTLRTILDIFDKKKVTYTLAAFTGNAAKRMSSATGREANTLHTTFRFIPDGLDDMESFDLETDVLIIDEMSMNSGMLTHRVLRRLPAGTRLIMVGDINQLPPIGAGEPMAQIMQSDVIPTAWLTYDWRNQGRDKRAEAAQNILLGKMPVTDFADGGYAHYGPESGRQNIAKDVIKAIKRLLEIGYNIDDIQVLTPMNKYDFGRISMSKRILELVSEDDEIPGSDLRANARVIHLENNRELGVMNGEVGTVNGVYLDEDGAFEKTDTVPLVHVQYHPHEEEVGYTREYLHQINLAYAITIHKSQGAEYKCVIVAVPRAKMGTRTLLYTAVTRKTEKVITVGSLSTVQQWIDNDTRDSRHTRLAEFIVKELEARQ